MIEVEQLIYYPFYFYIGMHIADHWAGGSRGDSCCREFVGQVREEGADDAAGDRRDFTSVYVESALHHGCFFFR